MTISIREATALAVQLLQASGIKEARMDAGSLMSHVLGRDRTFLIAHSEFLLNEEQMLRFRLEVDRRARREPLQYITGVQEFFRREFEVNGDVLIPRAETEIIVEAALELLQNEARPFVADVGTGSGCIIISLLDELPRAHGVATDISGAALRVANNNARRHKVADRLTLVQGDCLSPLRPSGVLNLITSNPPYVSDRELDTLQPELRYEPSAALFADRDGLATISRLLSEAPRRLQTNGYLIFEIGFGQSEAVTSLIDRSVWRILEIRKDLQGIPRTVILQKKAPSD